MTVDMKRVENVSNWLETNEEESETDNNDSE